jgi:hypothetical protein
MMRIHTHKNCIKMNSITRYTFDVNREDGGFKTVTIRLARDEDDFFDTFATIREVEDLLRSQGTLISDIEYKV